MEMFLVPIPMVYIRFARVCSNVDDFNNRNLFLTAKLLKQGYRYHQIRKAFSKFYHRHSELIVKYNFGLKTLLQQGISEPIFYGDSVHKFKRDGRYFAKTTCVAPSHADPVAPLLVCGV